MANDLVYSQKYCLYLYHHNYYDLYDRSHAQNHHGTHEEVPGSIPGFSTKIGCCGVWFTLHGVASGGACKRLHCGRKDEKRWWILVVVCITCCYNLNPQTSQTLLRESVNVFYICVVSWPVTSRAYMTYNTNTATVISYITCMKYFVVFHLPLAATAVE